MTTDAVFMYQSLYFHPEAVSFVNEVNTSHFGFCLVGGSAGYIRPMIVPLFDFVCFSCIFFEGTTTSPWINMDEKHLYHMQS